MHTPRTVHHSNMSITTCTITVTRYARTSCGVNCISAAFMLSSSCAKVRAPITTDDTAGWCNNQAIEI